MGRSAIRLFVVAATTFGLTVVVAWGARGVPVARPPAAAEAAVRTAVGRGPLVVAAILGVIGIGVLVFALWPDGTLRGELPRPRWSFGTVVALALFAVLARRLADQGTEPEAGAAAGGPEAAADVAGAASGGWAVGLYGAVAVLLAAALLWALRTPRPAPVAGGRDLPSGDRDEASRAAWAGATGSLGRILGSDPRARILASYATFEAEMAAAGVGRLPSDTPLQFQWKVVDAHPSAGSAVRRLTAAFLQAGFGGSPVGADLAATAESALDVARRAVRPPVTP